MTTIIPATIEGASTELGGIHSLQQAKEWQRSAIVSAFVRLGEQGDNRFTVERNSAVYSPGRFAALGIAGLHSDNTVRFYVNAWLNTHDDTYPEPGAEVDLDGLGTFPPNNTGGRTSGSMTEVRRAIDLRGAEAVVAALPPEQRREIATAIRNDADLVTEEEQDALIEVSKEIRQDRAHVEMVPSYKWIRRITEDIRAFVAARPGEAADLRDAISLVFLDADVEGRLPS